MKKNIILLILLISTTCLSAQTLDFSKLEGRWDTTKTVQFEPAQYQIVYDYMYAKDAKYPDAKRTAVTILRIGTQHNMFIDYGQLTFDSISASIARGESQATSDGPKLIGALKSIGFQELILLNRETKKSLSNVKQEDFKGINMKKKLLSWSGNYCKETVLLLDISAKRLRQDYLDEIT